MIEAAPASASPPTAASLQGVAKLYGEFAALRKVSIDFAVGSSTMIVGDNGAGKSTLLRMLAGLIAPSRGVVQVFGASPGNHRHRVAYMSHETMLYDELSAMENLQYFAALETAGGCDCNCAASPEMALRAVGLDPTLKRPVGQYSQGMRQRTSLARVLQSDPELLLLDEPFSNLDAESAARMVALLVDFRTWPVEGACALSGGTRGRTIILTTHQPQLAGTLAETTITMRTGTIFSVHGKDTVAA
jgi:ABC-type multidrug transport system ATPase subunit